MAESLTILLVGNGGREHALAWKLAQSTRVQKIFAAPGNGGTALTPKTTNIPLDMTDFEALVKFSLDHDVNLVIPGPEGPLVEGIERRFRRVGIPCFGPSEEAARMEGSKTFSKDFMARQGIPTAAFETFTDYASALAYADSVSHRIVIKASGLAAGKGVLIPETKGQIHEALLKIMKEREFGSAGEEVVIEEYLEGEELSVLAFSDGYTIRALPAAQDHKRIFDGDRGPNTGGMGCYSPIPVGTPELATLVHRTILQPTIDGMRKEGYPFVGLLFTGLMLTSDGPKVLEYNVRFGDPETQTILPLLDCDLAEIIMGCVDRRLDAIDIRILPGFSATVVAAAGGYPGSYQKGCSISVPAIPQGTHLFYAGALSHASDTNRLVTNGGRVLAVTSFASTLQSAVKAAYAAISGVHFMNIFYRKDIAHKAISWTNRDRRITGLTYADSGVSIVNGNALVEKIKPYVRATKRIGTDSEIGGFGGVFHLESCGFKNPVLISATDGVGTKLLVAKIVGRHDTVGIDLVAMNVNDLVVQGAEPLFFLDYFATSKLDINVAAAFIRGVAAGCKESGCALIGGETAEMPDIYHDDDYDAAGTAVGAVEKGHVLPRLQDMKVGDCLIGLSSSGIHSNGFSLVRKIIERSRLDYRAIAPWDATKTVGESLLTPTRIYVKPLLKLTKDALIKGMSHITGGGLVENVPRMLPNDLSAEIDLQTWKVPDIFKWLKINGDVPFDDIAKTLNMGIEIMKRLAQDDIVAWKIGKIVLRSQGMDSCKLINVESWDFT